MRLCVIVKAHDIRVRMTNHASSICHSKADEQDQHKFFNMFHHKKYFLENVFGAVFFLFLVIGQGSDL
jgi:hypothetical protein